MTISCLDRLEHSRQIVSVIPECDEQANAWIDAGDGRDPIGWNFINKGKDFIWLSEKDGWRHLYKISMDGKEILLSKGNYDVIDLTLIDEAGGRSSLFLRLLS